MHYEFTTLAELLYYTQKTAGNAIKGFCRFGLLTEATAQAVKAILNEGSQVYELLVESDSIRHTLAQHGIAKAKAEIARGQIPIIETDLLDLANWLHQPTAVRAGQAKPGKQPRIEMQWETATGTTVVIIEWRPGRQQLALVTMYKKKPAA